MTGRSQTMHGVAIYVRESGPALASERDAVNLLSEAFALNPEWLAVPSEHFAPEFFTLRTRLAGLFIQKLTNYGQKLAIIGDISRYVAESTALRDFVIESNRGRHVWFVADLADLERRLAQAAGC